MSPLLLLTNMLPDPFDEPPHVGFVGTSAEADIRAVTTNSSGVRDVEVPTTSYATAKRPYTPAAPATPASK